MFQCCTNKFTRQIVASVDKESKPTPPKVVCKYRHSLQMFRLTPRPGSARKAKLAVISPICTKDADQRITGFAGVAAGKIEMLFIDPDHRGQGLGKKLLNYAMQHLNADELDVNEQNPQALGFYFKQGFEVIGRSEVDGMGQPYPLLHMRLRQTQQRSSNG